MKDARCLLLAVGWVLVSQSAAMAQWSHNSAVNLGISVRGSDQNQCKSLAAPDGGTYLCWLDGIGTGWDTRVQRLNSHGVKQWGSNGIMVADTAFSSTQDYGFAQDGKGNLYVAYRDDANAGSPAQIKVQKIDPSGNLLWGSGTQVSVTAGGNAPHVCTTTDGGAVVGWSLSGVRLQKVDSNGIVQWAADGVNDTLASGTPSLADVCAGDNGGVIALYVKGTAPRHLFTRKFDSSGVKVWNMATTPLPLFDEASNGVQIGATIYIQSDGAGGAIYTWYGTGGTRNSYVQHITSAGAEVFAHNGATIAADITNRMRISAAVGQDPSTGDLYMVSKEATISPQGNYNIRAQRFNSAGARQWGNLGVELTARGVDQSSFEQVQAVAGGGAMFAWYNGGFNTQKVYATRLDSAGSFAWIPNLIDACSLLGGKARLWSAINPAGNRMVLTWGDNRTDGNDIYGQNVNLDGSLGNPGDVNDDGVVNIDDLVGVITSWGACAPYCPADLTPPPSGDGQVNIDDLVKVITSWG